MFESPDGSWQVASVLENGRHRYRITRDGALHTETGLLAEVHDVLAGEAGLDPAQLNGAPGPRPTTGG